MSPASAATSSTDAPWIPRSANTFSAASSRAGRSRSRRSCLLSRSTEFSRPYALTFDFAGMRILMDASRE